MNGNRRWGWTRRQKELYRTLSGVNRRLASGVPVKKAWQPVPGCMKEIRLGMVLLQAACERTEPDDFVGFLRIRDECTVWQVLAICVPAVEILPADRWRRGQRVARGLNEQRRRLMDHAERQRDMIDSLLARAAVLKAADRRLYPDHKRVVPELLGMLEQRELGRDDSGPGSGGGGWFGDFEDLLKRSAKGRRLMTLYATRAPEAVRGIVKVMYWNASPAKKNAKLTKCIAVLRENRRGDRRLLSGEPCQPRFGLGRAAGRRPRGEAGACGG